MRIVRENEDEERGSGRVGREAAAVGAQAKTVREQWEARGKW